MKFFPICSLILFNVIFQYVILEVNAMAATTLAPTTHIASYVHQLKKKKKAKAKHDELTVFNFESIKDDLKSNQAQDLPHRGAMLQLYGRLVQHLDSGAKQTINSNKTKLSDDSPDSKQNTLYNSKEIFGNSNQHESPNTMQHVNNSVDGMWNRNKQSIPVLEPVKHLVNSVREGAFNTTFHNHHHQLFSPHAMNGMDHTQTQNESSAIETEEDRETVNDSTEFKLLEMLGRLGSVIWSFLQSLFAASSGTASASSSSSSSGGNR